MLARLRHHTLVGRNHQHHQIDPVRTRQHVLDETFVSGNIDEANANIAQIKIGKPQVDGNTAFLFFRQAVGVGACQVAHQRALSVINMSGRAYDDGMHTMPGLSNVYGSR